MPLAIFCKSNLDFLTFSIQFFTRDGRTRNLCGNIKMNLITMQISLMTKLVLVIVLIIWSFICLTWIVLINVKPLNPTQLLKSSSFVFYDVRWCLQQCHILQLADLAIAEKSGIMSRRVWIKNVMTMVAKLILLVICRGESRLVESQKLSLDK